MPEFVDVAFQGIHYLSFFVLSRKVVELTINFKLFMCTSTYKKKYINYINGCINTLR